MKVRYQSEDVIEAPDIASVGGPWDVCTTEEENLWHIARDLDLREIVPMPEDMYVLASFTCFEVGFTAPKGKIEVKLHVDNDYLAELLKIVEHPRERLQVMMFAAKKAFPRDG